MLQADYDWTPDDYTTSIIDKLFAHGSALYISPISKSDRDQLQNISISSADNFLLKSIGITQSNFLDLIRPDTLDHSVLTHLFKLGLKPYNTSVNLVPPTLTQHLSSYGKGFYKPLDGDSEETIKISQALFTHNISVYLFGMSDHYTTVISNCKDRTFSYIVQVHPKRRSPFFYKQTIIKSY